jgi:hypothetical protein
MKTAREIIAFQNGFLRDQLMIHRKSNYSKRWARSPLLSIFEFIFWSKCWKLLDLRVSHTVWRTSFLIWKFQTFRRWMKKMLHMSVFKPKCLSVGDRVSTQFTFCFLKTPHSITFLNSWKRQHMLRKKTSSESDHFIFFPKTTKIQ